MNGSMVYAGSAQCHSNLDTVLAVSSFCCTSQRHLSSYGTPNARTHSCSQAEQNRDAALRCFVDDTDSPLVAGMQNLLGLAFASDRKQGVTFSLGIKTVRPPIWHQAPSRNWISWQAPPHPYLRGIWCCQCELMLRLVILPIMFFFLPHSPPFLLLFWGFAPQWRDATVKTLSY